MDVKDKKVIVTGGVQGIGRSLVEKLVIAGATVGVFDIDSKGLATLKKNNKNLYCKKCDISSELEVKTAVDDFYKEFKNIDILINNAGLIYSSPLVSFTKNGIKKHDVNMWHKVIRTDLDSVFYTTVNVVEKMILKRTRGVIINVSSICAAGNAGQSAYSAAKAGVNAATAAWAKELGLMGIRVVSIAPGFTDTVTMRQAISDNVLRDLLRKVPLRRLGKVEEIAEAIIAIIKNDFINGKVFEIDGGLVIN